MDFTTAQKKTARELINKALQKDSRECLEKAEALLQNRKHDAFQSSHMRGFVQIDGKF
ncbi:hypothetical protein [Candidatus Symbiothrix dinenymphae]|uniref:hypothetical protein n=1 Tax=Candidatus Symbiothrix dinenymphae TaxID=467085 RepID=UPI000A860FEC|nr:hypothetical protein [Candidatus Symbiothrix dinenymphae]